MSIATCSLGGMFLWGDPCLGPCVKQANFTIMKIQVINVSELFACVSYDAVCERDCYNLVQRWDCTLQMCRNQHLHVFALANTFSANTEWSFNQCIHRV